MGRPLKFMCAPERAGRWRQAFRIATLTWATHRVVTATNGIQLVVVYGDFLAEHGDGHIEIICLGNSYIGIDNGMFWTEQRYNGRIKVGCTYSKKNVSS